MARHRKHDEDEVETEREVQSRHRPDERPPNERGPAGSGGGDRHGVGAPMGGTAVGGLAGTNVGHGDPENADIDAAGGGGDFDRDLDADQEQAYAGHAGGAVGGTPANKRAVGGQPPRPFDAEPSVGESTIGRDPHPKKRPK